MHTRRYARHQVSSDFIMRVAQRVDHANSGNINHLSHPDIEW
jgi:hypothetical protein